MLGARSTAGAGREQAQAGSAGRTPTFPWGQGFLGRLAQVLCLLSKAHRATRSLLETDGQMLVTGPGRPPGAAGIGGWSLGGAGLRGGGALHQVGPSKAPGCGEWQVERRGLGPGGQWGWTGPDLRHRRQPGQHVCTNVLVWSFWLNLRHHLGGRRKTPLNVRERASAGWGAWPHAEQEGKGAGGPQAAANSGPPREDAGPEA